MADIMIVTRPIPALDCRLTPALDRPSSPTTLRRGRWLTVSAALHGMALTAALLIGAPSPPPVDEPSAVHVELVPLVEPSLPEPEPAVSRPHAAAPAPRRQPVHAVAAPAKTSVMASAAITPAAETTLAPAPASPAVTAPPAGPPPDYIALIRSLLERGKRYPRSARLDGIEGIVMLKLTLDRTGAVMDWRIETGSGSAALDAAAADMLLRASPFPPFPPELAQDRLELVVPVAFSLRGK